MLYLSDRTTTRIEGWKDFVLDPDETLYWQGCPERAFVRWETFIFPLLATALISFEWYVSAFEIPFLLFGTLCVWGIVFAVHAFRCFRLSQTRYTLTDERVIVEDTASSVRYEYDLEMYLTRWKGFLFESESWLPSNRWDLIVLSYWSKSDLRCDRQMKSIVCFASLSQKNMTAIKRAESKIRARYHAPAPDPRYYYRTSTKSQA